MYLKRTDRKRKDTGKTILQKYMPTHYLRSEIWNDNYLKNLRAYWLLRILS